MQDDDFSRIAQELFGRHFRVEIGERAVDKRYCFIGERAKNRIQVLVADGLARRVIGSCQHRQGRIALERGKIRLSVKFQAGVARNLDAPIPELLCDVDCPEILRSIINYRGLLAFRKRLDSVSGKNREQRAVGAVIGEPPSWINTLKGSYRFRELLLAPQHERV